jgi:hypothetical protein
MHYRVRDDVLLLVILVVLTLMIGLRYQVGGDWNVYAVTFRSVTLRPLDVALSRTPDEAVYTIMNWLVGKAGFQIWLVNLICAVPFIAGLTAFCRQQPNPWLAFAVAAPLFIIVVGMGYTRQAAAAGFMLIGMAGLTRGRSFAWFVGWALLGSAFHTSLLIFIPVMAVVVFRATFLWLLAFIIAMAVAYYVILPTALERYSVGYIHNVYEAKGAIFRIVPNAFAGLFVVAFPKQFASNPMELKVWRGWGWLALIAFGAFFLVASSVIIDRLSIYLLPLQIFVLARLPNAFRADRKPSLALTVFVLIYSALVLFFWLNFANNARYWVPYRLYPFG